MPILSGIYIYSDVPHAQKSESLEVLSYRIRLTSSGRRRQRRPEEEEEEEEEKEKEEKKKKNTKTTAHFITRIELNARLTHTNFAVSIETLFTLALVGAS